MSNLLFSIVWFTFLYFGTIYVFKKENIFTPIKFISIIYVLRNITYLIVLYFDQDIFPDYILQAINLDLEAALPKYILVQTIAFIFLILGTSILKKKPQKRKIIQLDNIRVLSTTSYVLLIIGVLSYFIFISQIGGIFYLLSNLDSRVELQSGAYSLILMQLITIGIVFRIKIYGQIKSNLNKYTFVLFFLVAILLNSSLGGRKSTVFIILVSIASYHFYIKKISLKSLRFSRIAILILFLSIYTFLVPILRSPNGLDKVLSGEEQVLDKVNFSELVGYFSYTYIDVFTANYFNYDNKWDFATFYTIPKNLDLSKSNYLRPPIDEGVYYYNIARHNLVFKPPTDRYKMHISSLPIENFGFGYANGLIPGVICSFFLLGLVYKYSYNLLLGSYNHPIMLYLYIFILFNFNFSSLRIMNLVYLLISMIVAIIIYKSIKYIS